MGNVKVIFEDGNEKLLSVDSSFFYGMNQGEFLIIDGKRHEITAKCVDPQEMDFIFYLGGRQEVKSNLLNETIELIQEGAKLQAVKLVKDRSGIGLKESKDFVDVLAEVIKL